MKLTEAFKAVDRVLVDGVPVVLKNPHAAIVSLHLQGGGVVRVANTELPLPDNGGWYWVVPVGGAEEVPLEFQLCATASALAVHRTYVDICPIPTMH